MNTSALITMVITQVGVSAFTLYFFYLVLKKPEVKHDDDRPDA